MSTLNLGKAALKVHNTRFPDIHSDANETECPPKITNITESYRKQGGIQQAIRTSGIEVRKQQASPQPK
jgi:hypothetical protein